MNKSAVLRALSIAWSDLRVACHTVKDRDCEALLDRAVAECEKGEREHRAMGRRWLAGTGSTASYALSVHDAARVLMYQHVIGGSKRPRSWTGVADVRRDCALAFAVHDAIKEANGAAYLRALASQPAAKTILAVNYAGDIAQ